MAKPARRKDLDQLAAKLEDITDTIVALRLDVEREAEARALQACPPQLAQTLERVATLLTGATVALERMGGTTLPAFREDISSLRAQMSELQHEMAGYRAAQMDLANLVEKLRASDWPPVATDAAAEEKIVDAAPSKHHGRRDKAALDEVQRLGLMDQWRNRLDQDVATAEDKPKRRPGRPRKSKPAEDTSQKLIDEAEQEAVEE